MSAELTTVTSPSISAGTSTRLLAAASAAWFDLMRPSTVSNASSLCSSTIRTLRANGLNALSNSCMVPSACATCGRGVIATPGPHGEEPREARRLEPWRQTRLLPSFETRRFATLLRMRPIPVGTEDSGAGGGEQARRVRDLDVDLQGRDLVAAIHPDLDVVRL